MWIAAEVKRLGGRGKHRAGENGQSAEGTESPAKQWEALCMSKVLALAASAAVPAGWSLWLSFLFSFFSLGGDLGLRVGGISPAQFWICGQSTPIQLPVCGTWICVIQPLLLFPLSQCRNPCFSSSSYQQKSLLPPLLHETGK